MMVDIMAEEFILMGAVKDNAPRASQKGRKDKRRIQTLREHFILDSGKEYILLDAKEEGELYQVTIVADNPYLEVFLQIDGWSVGGITAAEILSEPPTGRLLSNFQAVDGGHPAFGYSLIFNPDIPEKYDGRLRVKLKNKIIPTKDILGGFNGYTSKGDLATPNDVGFIAGFTAIIPSYSSHPNNNLGISGDNESVGAAIAHDPSIDFLHNPGQLNGIFTTPKGSRKKMGILNPYVGLAGKPMLTWDTTTFSTGYLHVFWDNPVDDTIQKLPSWGVGGTSQDIWIVDFAGGPHVISEFVAGDRLFFRDSERFYFPGFVFMKASNQNLPVKFASNAGTAYGGAIRVQVIPGMKNVPPPFRILANPNMGVSATGFGVVTSKGDTNPQILIHKAEVKRMKRYSYDG